VFPDKKHIHFVGIGGIGMSAIATVLLEMGYKVSGSDIEPNAITERIERLDGVVYNGHAASNISDDTGLVVYSSSIGEDNPEIKEARRRGIKIEQRAEALAGILNSRSGIAVTGTHGKTTTTSMIAVMTENNGLDPTVMIGGEVGLFNGNAKYGRGKYVVAEADESDGSFRFLKPLYSVITNIEMEHLDYYRGLEHVLESYAGFANNLKPDGTLIYNSDDENIVKMMKRFRGRSAGFGLSKEDGMYPAQIRMSEFDTLFKCMRAGKDLGEVRLKVPGLHNVLNAMAAILVGLELGLSFGAITAALADFKGTKRRFHLRADAGGVMLIEDYAHHPTEIRAVLETCRNWKNRRIIAIFQPHRYSRTLFLADDFGRCFGSADKLILTDIYAASEEPIEGVSVELIRKRAVKNGQEDVVVIPKEGIAGYVMNIKRPGDMILVLGAGDIKDVADELAALIGSPGAHEKEYDRRI
jgi:UDP-N-acetylmuramate--alanine ligase